VIRNAVWPYWGRITPSDTKGVGIEKNI